MNTKQPKTVSESEYSLYIRDTTEMLRNQNIKIAHLENMIGEQELTIKNQKNLIDTLRAQLKRKGDKDNGKRPINAKHIKD